MRSLRHLAVVHLRGRDCKATDQLVGASPSRWLLFLRRNTERRSVIVRIAVASAAFILGIENAVDLTSLPHGARRVLMAIATRERSRGAQTARISGWLAMRAPSLRHFRRIQSVPGGHGVQVYPSFVQPRCGWASCPDPWVLSDRSRWSAAWLATIPGPRSDTDLGCRGLDSQSRYRLGHLEEFRVPVRRRDRRHFQVPMHLEIKRSGIAVFASRLGESHGWDFSRFPLKRCGRGQQAVRSPLRMRRDRLRSITYSRTLITESWVETGKTDSAGCSTES